MNPTPTPPRSHLPSPQDAGTRQLRRAVEADLDPLSRALADAFYDDPIYSWLLPGDSTRRERLRVFFELELRIFGLDRGVAWTTDQLDGAAIVTPPDRWKLPTGAAIKNFGRYRTVFRSRRVAIRDFRYLLHIEKHHLREPHYYLAAVGVAPSAQGQGLGTLMLGPTLEACDEGRLAAYVEATCEDNARLYERLGFERTRELRYRDSPPLILMRREPGSGR